MGFFFADAKKEATTKSKPRASVKRKDIPIASLQALGCSVCPNDGNPQIKTPKIKPTGTKTPRLYLLGTSPNETDDANDDHWTGRAGLEIFEKFGIRFMQENSRSNFIVQCRSEPTAVIIECCRNRIVSDIEATKPEIVVTIGDEPFGWVTGLNGSVLAHRGTKMVARIGRHTCWVVPMMYPMYALKKNARRTNEFELTFAHDVRVIKDLLNSRIKPVSFVAPYDTGIELITGAETNDMGRLEQALHELLKEPRSSLDIETNGLRPYMMADPHIWTAAVGTFNRTIAFPVDHPDGWGTEVRIKRAKGNLAQYLMESGRKSCHNLAMEMEWLCYFFGPDLLRRTEWDDTMAIAHTLDERPGTKSLDYQCLINFGFSLKALSNIDTKRIIEYPLKQVLRYNGMDTKWTDKLRDHRMPELQANPLYLAEYERKVRLAPTLVLTETKGLQVDFKYAKKQSDLMTSQLVVIEKQIDRCPEVKEYRTQYGAFSPTNTDHVLKLLKEVCQRDEVRVEDQRSGAVRWTTDEEALSKIPKSEVPSVELVLEHRGLSKILGTYIKPILDKKIVCPDGKVRPKYSSMIAVTGRLAAEDPNVQNWPKRKHREIRGIITSDAGGVLAALDYGQIEFRVVGMASEDPNLVKACWTGYDVHKFWAERMVALYPPIIDWIVETFEVDWDEKGLKTLRQESKNKWVFPQLFGSSLDSCAQQLHLPDHVALTLGGEFWDEFRTVKKWQGKLIQSYEKNLYVETLGGRRRRGPMTKNEIINMPIQGTACDIVLEAMCAISEQSYINDDSELQPAINVHDDLTFQISDANVDTKMDLIATEMCRHRFDYINVPLIVEASIGLRWHALEEVKVYRSNEIFKMTNPYL